MGGGADLSEADRLYNRYDWFCRLPRIYTEKFGYDAGVEQQRDVILQYIDCDVDSDVLEQISEGTLPVRR